MKTEISKKAGYEAPRIEAAGFVTENGYAASGTTQVNGLKLGVGSGSL